MRRCGVVLVLVLAAAAVVVVAVVRPGVAAAVPAQAATPGLSTLAGSGAVGHVDGVGGAASFDSLSDSAMSPDGQSLYVLDKGTDGRPNTIRRIAVASGEVSTVVSGGVLKDATNHIWVDAQQRVWVELELPSEKVIVRFPAGGGEPTTMLSGICCWSWSDAGGAFAIDPSGQYLY